MCFHAFYLVIMLIDFACGSKMEIKYIQPDGSKPNFKKLIQHPPMQCQAHDIVMVIRWPLCDPVKIPNKYCNGPCTSRVYPVEDYAFTFCKACMPTKVSKLKVKLNCPRDPIKKRRHKYVPIVEGCACRKNECDSFLPEAMRRRMKRSGSRLRSRSPYGLRK